MLGRSSRKPAGGMQCYQVDQPQLLWSVSLHCVSACWVGSGYSVRLQRKATAQDTRLRRTLRPTRYRSAPASANSQAPLWIIQETVNRREGHILLKNGISMLEKISMPVIQAEVPMSLREKSKNFETVQVVYCYVSQCQFAINNG